MTDENNNQKFYGFETAKIDWHESYKLLLHCVAPRPIAFVSTLSKKGEANLAPFSFFMGGGANPPSVAFSPGTGEHGQFKDTLLNIKETGEYTINVVSEKIVAQMNQTSFSYERGISEWDKVGLTKAPAVIVRPAHVAESLMAMECKLHQIVQHGEGAGSANYVIGEVVYFHIAKSIMDEGRVDPTRVDYVARLGGLWYTRTGAESMFQLKRPEQP